MTDVILVLNAGSSSLKFALYPKDQDGGDPFIRGNISGIGSAPRIDARQENGNKIPRPSLPDVSHLTDYGDFVSVLLGWLSSSTPDYKIIAAAHRVVHGGQDFSAPVIITPKILQTIQGLTHLAPLHQPTAIAVIKAVSKTLPELTQIADFDTRFHMTMPRIAKLFALPRALTKDGVLRYGFHGLSYDYIAGELPKHLGARANGRIIIAHLGHGASLCAVDNLKSVATTMGLTALDGLVMATRCGNLDPGVLLYLLQQKKLSADEVSDLLYHKSGLLGVSEISADVRALEQSTDPCAKEALELFVYRAVQEIGALSATIGGMDTLVFTAGIGENSATLRRMICEKLSWLGAELDITANLKNRVLVSTAGSKIDILVIPTNEEVVLARGAKELLADEIRGKQH